MEHFESYETACKLTWSLILDILTSIDDKLKIPKKTGIYPKIWVQIHKSFWISTYFLARSSSFFYINFFLNNFLVPAKLNFNLKLTNFHQIKLSRSWSNSINLINSEHKQFKVWTSNISAIKIKNRIAHICPVKMNVWFQMTPIIRVS